MTPSPAATDDSQTPFFQKLTVQIAVGILAFLFFATVRYYRAQHRAARFAQTQVAPAPQMETLPAPPPPTIESVPVAAPPAPYSPARGFGSTRVAPDPPARYDRGVPTFTDPRAFSGMPGNAYGGSQRRRPGYGTPNGLGDAERIREMAEQINAQNALRREQRTPPDSQAPQDFPATPPQEAFSPEQPGQYVPQPPNQEQAPVAPAPPVPDAGGSGTEIPRF